MSTADQLPGGTLPPACQGGKTGSCASLGKTLAATIPLSSSSQGWGQDSTHSRGAAPASLGCKGPEPRLEAWTLQGPGGLLTLGRHRWE